MILIKYPQNWGLKEEKVKEAAKKALQKLGYRENKVELSIIFVGRKRAKKINETYRRKSYVPQVLAFPMSKEVDDDGLIRLGDIVICTAKLKYEAKWLEKNLDVVLREWMIHGVENLLERDSLM